MSFYVPPDIGEFFTSISVSLAIFNFVCLIVTIVWWARVDNRSLRQEMLDLELYPKAVIKQAMARRRADYFYSQGLPLFVERSPLRLLMHRSSAPSLGPVLVVLVVQSLPAISLFIGTWYAIHAGWHIFKFLEKQVKEKTPTPLKRLLLTPWF